MKEDVMVLEGLWNHFLLSLRLNFRSKQAIAYGYLVPLLFLVAFGSVFRAESPALLHQMGQLLTITVLGGACFGMPTSLVAERERGIWRRYRLLPVGKTALLAGVAAARLVLILSAVGVQIFVARIVYGTPLPVQPFQTLVAVVVVIGCFLGLGLIVAALADNVPAVQALGQCLFLPLIMIGGVGIPLVALPSWAQRTAGFLPGRYAVDLVVHCYRGVFSVAIDAFNIAALAVIGMAATAVGLHLFRWEGGAKLARSGRVWLGAGFAAWALVGIAATTTGHLDPVRPSVGGYEHIGNDEIALIRYDNLPGDSEFVSRLAAPFDPSDPRRNMSAWPAKLREWGPGHDPDAAQSARSLLAVAAIGDVSEDPHEGEIARLVYDNLRLREGDARLERILAWIILYPAEGKVVTTVPELGLGRSFSERIIRERIDLYARKFLGRLERKIAD